MKGIQAKQNKLNRRHGKIRARITGTVDRPRLSVYKSNRFLEAQLIDDLKGMTLASASTREYAGKQTKGAKGKTKKSETTKLDASIKLGTELAARAKAKGISKVVFDRGGFRYTGRIASFADAARKAGLVF